MESLFKFDIPKNKKSIIKVIGVGGGGSNAVNHMFNQGIRDVDFVVCNTDAQALNSSPVPNKLQIGIGLTNGLGAGANPERGRSAALESKEDIREILDDNTKMVFITAGMGGGTGTGAAPVLAKIAKDMDILTVGIVTVPFAFEGKKKMAQAELGIQMLKENCDTVLVIINDKLREIYGNLSISDAFAQADNILTTAAKGIAEIITVPGYVNVDFEDVRTVMLQAGPAVMGSAKAEGENRARKAAEQAISSPLLNNQDIHGAQKILLSITSGEQAELQMDELSEITGFIQEIAGPDAEVIFGHGIDSTLENKISVTVIATGFHTNANTQLLQHEMRKVFDLETTRQIPLFQGKRIEPKSIPFEVEMNENIEKEYVPEEKEEVKEEIMEEDPAQLSMENQQEEEPEEKIRYTLEEEPETGETQEQEEEVKEETEFDRGFFFDSKPLEVTDEQNENEESDILEEDDDDDLFEEEEIFKMADHAEEELDEEGILELKSKKEFLQKQARERVERLKGISGHDLDADTFKEKLDVPAYLRKKVVFEKVPHSSESNISRYNLNDDNQILGNNRFLHDNVD
jgi:cell division protein FtsZ